MAAGPQTQVLPSCPQAPSREPPASLWGTLTQGDHHDGDAEPLPRGL